MVTVEEMGGAPVEITAMGYMPSEYSSKTGSYYDFSILVGYTDLDELDPRFDQNWSSTPVEVYSEPQLELSGIAGGVWIMFDFEQPFQYDASSNLLYEFTWNGPIDPPDSKIYSMNWEDEVNSVVTASSPDSSSGYPTTVKPNILFITSEAFLEAQTFAGIKSSF
ncbi:MAG: hypothetical protein B1H09_01215 [Gemmatimonadaceae bacterium 4484_173]|jgi:hypothetical protein|nr:MAG: hypothetical protein B1H09_01215 [Gemmatimonadaceae bacterium 4484_173]RKZ03656.1 MAG: hypothetical protein DRQ21_05180 [Candidatus Fermentibacteria bacterium]